MPPGYRHGATGFIPCGGIGSALVKHHDDIRSQLPLYLHGFFRSHEDRVAVDRRLEGHAVLGDPSQFAQTEDLETARICQDGPLPAHEVMQAAVQPDDIDTRAQHEVEGVAEDHTGTAVRDLLRRHRLDCAIGSDRHEGRCVHHTAAEDQTPAARLPVVLYDLEAHNGHSSQPAAGRGMNMASP